MIDWQTITVALIVLAAAAYVARRGWRRLRSFSRARLNDSTCETGCGKCPATKTMATPQTMFVPINRAKSSQRS
jgi:hypothetical protein